MSRALRLLAVLAGVAAGLALAGCGSPQVTGIGVAATDEGTYLTVGHLKYQVQLSRQINPYDTEDRDYLKGLPPGLSLGTSDIWFGVFMRVENDTSAVHAATSDYSITDTQRNTWRPVRLNLGQNLFAYHARTLGPTELLPNPESIAGSNAIRGELLLFKIPVADLQNRPLVLHIIQSGSPTASMELDL
jgi:hypothetical protein